MKMNEYVKERERENWVKERVMGGEMAAAGDWISS